MNNVLITLIQKRRLQKGLNFHDIEQATGIPAKRMYNFEKGNTHLSLDELDRLMKLLDLDHHHVTSVATKPRKKQWKWLPTLVVTILCIVVVLSIYSFWPKQDPTIVSEEEGNDISHNEQTVDLEEQESSEASEENSNLGMIDEANDSATKIRIWGALHYESESLPALETTGDLALEIFSVEELNLRKELPSWLNEHNTDHLLLNLATRYIFSTDTVKQRDQLNKLGIANVGLDYIPEAYNPYILDTEDGRIGVLALSRHVLEYAHIAQAHRIGLAYVREDNVLQEAIRSAKEQVDLLIVLIGWGHREDPISDTQQQKVAQLMAEAGADVIVGNHPVYAQEISLIGNTPVFYSLGHLTQSHRPQNKGNLVRFGYVIDIEIKDGQVNQYIIYPGKWIKGERRISFDLSETDKDHFKTQIISATHDTLQIR